MHRVPLCNGTHTRTWVPVPTSHRTHACPPGGIAALTYPCSGAALFCHCDGGLSRSSSQRVVSRSVRIVLSGERQREGDGGAAALDGLEPDAAALPLHQLMAEE